MLQIIQIIKINALFIFILYYLIKNYLNKLKKQHINDEQIKFKNHV
jgi:hypothetical protein